MEVKPGYKQTEVGVIPEDWVCAKLSEFFSFISYGFTNPMPTVHDGVFMITAADINDGRVQLETARKTSESAYHTLLTAKSKPRQNDILLTKDGTLGRLALVGEETICINQSVAVIRPNQRVEPQFLKLLLESPRYQKRMVEDAGGSTIKHIYITIVDKMLLGLPLDKGEQRAIATALSDADGLLGGLDRLIAKKRDLKQAAVQQLLTGQTRLPGFGPTASFKEYVFGSIPDDWDVKPLKSVSTMNGRIGWQGLKQEEFTVSPNDPFLITGMNFKDGKIRWDEVYHIPEKRYLEATPIQLRRNDILMTKDGTIGKLLYVEHIPHPGRASLNSHLLVFRPIAGRYNPRFLFYQLSSPTFVQHVELHKSGTTFFGLSQAATGKYPTVLPSVPEQTAIAEVLTEMDAELVALQQRREKTRALKQAMMQELLTGRTRLI